MLRQYPSYSHSSILRLPLKVTLSQPMEKGGIALDPGCREHASKEARALMAPLQEAALHLQLLWTRKSVGITQSGNWSPSHRKLALGWIPRHTRLYTWTHIYTNSNAKTLTTSCLWIVERPTPLPLPHGWQMSPGFIPFFSFIFSYLTSCFYSVAGASCLVYFRLL